MKKIFILIAAFTVSISVFAQNAKSTGLSDSDVKNWIKNSSAIENALDELDIDVDDIDLLSAKDRASVESILRKYGISAPKSLEKYMKIIRCSTVLFIESQMDSATLKMMESMGIDSFNGMKSEINSKDYAVVAANSSGVLNVFAALGDESDYDFEDDEDEDFDYASGNVEYMEKIVQPAIDEINDSIVMKTQYEVLSKSKGDCGLIYKKADGKNASKYSKSKSIDDSLDVFAGTEIELEDEPSPYDDTVLDGMYGTVDLKKKKISIEFCWTEASFDPDSYEYVKRDYINKELNFNIKSVELYVAKTGDERREYVITTKEGLVLHLWSCESDDGNAYVSEVNFKGMDDTFEWDWCVSYDD